MDKNWDGETCKVCGRIQRLAWIVSDKLWEQVVIEYWRHKTLCLECFFGFASDNKITLNLNDITFLAIV